MGGEGVGCGVSANKNSCTHHVTWSPNKLGRSNSIFNLWLGPTYVDVVAGVGAAEAGHRRHARAVDCEHVLLALKCATRQNRKIKHGGTVKFIYNSCIC